ncbi:MAG: hypothetical protein ACOZDY_14595 [Pseudomonadota bacterium]
MTVILRSARAVAFASALTWAVPAVAADDLGRLFFSPAERRQLDQMRSSPVTDRQAARVTVNGVVKSSSGRSVVWVNGVPYAPASQGGPGIVHSAGNGSAAVVTEPGKAPVRIKVGESVTFLPGADPEPR